MINFGSNNPVKNTKLVFDKFDNIMPSEDIKKFIETLRTRFELEMPDVGSFRPIEEMFTNHKPVLTFGNVKLSLKPTSNLNTSSERILEAFVTTKSGMHTLEQAIAKGKTDEIMKLIKDDKFDHNLKKFLMDCSDYFESKGLQ